MTAPGAPLPDLDLTEEAEQRESPELRAVSSRSLAWAGIVRPFTWFLFVLLAAAMALPFLLIGFLDTATGTDRVEKAVEWAHTILPPLVGFVGAVVGYYFGTRGDKEEGAGGGS